MSDAIAGVVVVLLGAASAVGLVFSARRARGRPLAVGELGWRPRLRGVLGGAFYCPRCSARLDTELGVFEIASPSRLHAEHAPVCPEGPAARALAELAEALAPLAGALRASAEAAAEALARASAARPRKPDRGES